MSVSDPPRPVPHRLIPLSYLSKDVFEIGVGNEEVLKEGDGPAPPKKSGTLFLGKKK